MRFAATSACTSSANLTSQITPRASRTLIFAFESWVDSSRKVNGPWGTRDASPGPQNRSSCAMDPGSCHRMGTPDQSGTGGRGPTGPPDAQPTLTAEETTSRVRIFLIVPSFGVRPYRDNTLRTRKEVLAL